MSSGVLFFFSKKLTPFHVYQEDFHRFINKSLTAHVDIFSYLKANF